jgi:hypothetical protein
VRRIGRRLRVPVTRIGLIMPARSGMKERNRDSSLHDLAVTSYRHFT